VTPRHSFTAIAGRAVVALLLLTALAGCSSATPGATTAPPSASIGKAPCTGVSVIVDFGSLGAHDISACAPAGVAAEVLKAAKITTAGTADYGDQVVCRVDDLPSPSAESCATLPSAAYWALWVKDAGGVWAYAQDGVATLQLKAGQSLGLVYTTGTETTPPQG
jgi:hypothetical protein